MVKIMVGNIYSKIIGFIPPPVQESLDHTLSYKMMGARFMPQVKNKAWDGVVRLYYVNKGQSFYTGLLAFVRDILKKNKIEYEIIDQRIKPEQNMLNLTFTPPPWYDERDYQVFTIERSMKFTRGILSMCTGSGKTLTVVKMISQIKTYPFIFYVLTVDLMEQAHGVLSMCLNEPIGKIGDGNCDIRKINVCTIQTAVQALNADNKKFNINDYKFDDEDVWDEKAIDSIEKAEAIRKLIRSAQGVYMDECVSGESRIVTEKGELSISEAMKKKCRFVQTHDGINIVFKPILKWWVKKNRETVSITLKNKGNLVCTKNHIVCTKRGWLKAKDLTTTDELLCVNVAAEGRYRVSTIDRENTYWDIRSQQERSKNGGKFMIGTLRNYQNVPADVGKRFCRGIKRLKVLLGQRGRSVVMADISGGMINSQYGKNITLSQQYRRDKLLLARASEIHLLPFPINVLETTGCVPTMVLDKKNGCGTNLVFCEGMVSKHSLETIPDSEISGCVCGQNAFPLLPKSQDGYMMASLKELRERFWSRWGILAWRGGFATTEALRELGQNIYQYIQRDGPKGKTKTYPCGLENRVMIAKCVYPAKKKQVRGIAICSSQSNQHGNYLEEYRLSSPSVCNTKWQKIANISPCKKQDVYDIEVKDTHCFFADNILVHNCHHTAARTVKDVLSASPNSFWRFGGSGTVSREDGAEIMIQAMFGSKVVDVSASYLIKRGFLVRPYIFFEQIDSAQNFHSYKKIYENCVSKNEKFNKHVAETAAHLVQRGLSVLVLVQHYPQGDFIKSLLPDVQFVTSRMTSQQRKEAIQNLRDGTAKCLIGTSLLDEGVDVPELDAVLLAGGGKSCTRVHQRIGRTLRTNKNKAKDKAIVIVYEHNAKFLDKHAHRLRRILKKESEFRIMDSKGEDFIKYEIDNIIGIDSKPPSIFDS